jgi:hypothetical protein
MRLKKALGIGLAVIVFSTFVGAGVLSSPKKVRAQTDDLFVDEYEFEEEEFEEAVAEWEREMERLSNDPEFEEATVKAGVVGFITSLFSSIISLIIGLAVYIFSAYTFYVIANKLGYKEKAWMAFVPIANAILLFQMAEMNPLYLLMVLVPCVGWLILLVFVAKAWMKLSEKLGFQSWLGILAVIYPINLGVMAYLAWAEPTEK